MGLADGAPVAHFCTHFLLSAPTNLSSGCKDISIGQFSGVYCQGVTQLHFPFSTLKLEAKFALAPFDAEL